MDVTEPKGTFISLETAQELRERFLEQCDHGLTQYPFCFEYSMSRINELIERQENAVGVRIYAGLVNSGLRTVLVATNANGEDLLEGEFPCLDEGHQIPPP